VSRRGVTIVPLRDQFLIHKPRRRGLFTRPFKVNSWNWKCKHYEPRVQAKVNSTSDAW